MFRHFHSIPMLSLSNMLHKLHYINDSLAIGLTSYSIDPKNSLLAYYLGNIYVVDRKNEYQLPQHHLVYIIVKFKDSR